MIFVNSAFNHRLEQENVGTFVELISIEGAGFQLYWTTLNQELFATLSGELVEYKPLPGQASGEIKSSTDLTVATMEFVFASSEANELFKLVNANQMDKARIRIDRVFADTPDLGKMLVYAGEIGDLGWNRQAVSAQGRNVWESVAKRWPYYTFGDGCVWRFGSAGCGFDTSSVTISPPASAYLVSSSSRIGIYCTSLNVNGDDYYTFGKVSFTGGVNSGQLRTVRAHIGNALQLSHSLPFDPQSGDTFDLFPGCRKRRVADCTSKYNNARNFCGYWTTPIPEEINVGA